MWSRGKAAWVVASSAYPLLLLLSLLLSFRCFLQWCFGLLLAMMSEVWLEDTSQLRRAVVPPVEKEYRAHRTRSHVFAPNGVCWGILWLTQGKRPFCVSFLLGSLAKTKRPFCVCFLLGSLAPTKRNCMPKIRVIVNPAYFFRNPTLSHSFSPMRCDKNYLWRGLGVSQSMLSWHTFGPFSGILALS